MHKKIVNLLDIEQVNRDISYVPYRYRVDVIFAELQRVQSIL